MKKYASGEFNLLKSSLVFYGLMMAVSILLIRVFEIDWRMWLSSRPQLWLVYAVVGFALAWLLVPVTYRVSWMGPLRKDLAGLTAMIGRQSIWVLLLVSAMAGIFEELLFRGILQELAMEYIGQVSGIVIVALLFGLAHFLSVTYFILASLYGVFLGALYAWHNDLIAVMLLHGVYDLVALYLAIYVYHPGQHRFVGLD